MSAVLTGTPVAIVWASGANPAAQNVTIPGDCTAVYVFGGFYSGGTNGVLSSLTLNGAAPSQSSELGMTGSFMGIFAAAWYNPATGVRALDPAWAATPEAGDGGPVTFVVFVKDGDTTAWRDVDSDQDASNAAVTVTLTTVSGDLVLKFNLNGAGAEPSVSASWSDGGSQTNNSFTCRLSSITASGTTQVCDAEDEEYASVIAVSIPAAAAGGGNQLQPWQKQGGMGALLAA